MWYDIDIKRKMIKNINKMYICTYVVRNKKGRCKWANKPEKQRNYITK